jgi:hypothetical protein
VALETTGSSRTAEWPDFNSTTRETWVPKHLGGDNDGLKGRYRVNRTLAPLCGLLHKARRYILSSTLGYLKSPIAQVNSAMSGRVENRLCNVEQALNEKVEGSLDVREEVPPSKSLQNLPSSVILESLNVHNTGET